MTKHNAQTELSGAQTSNATADSGSIDNSPRSSSSSLPTPRSPHRILPGGKTQKPPRTARSRTPQPEPQQVSSSLGENRIAIIGVGAMGGALCRGLVHSRIVAANQIIVSDPHAPHVQELARSLGVVAAEDNLHAARNAEIVVLAVKPYNIAPVVTEIAEGLVRNGHAPLLISIAAGVPTSRIEALLETLPVSPPTPVIRAMPNTPAQVGKGACAYCKGTLAGAEHMAQAGDIFRSFGIAVEVPEELMDAVTALSGSGPAYIYLMIEALIDGGVRAGLPRDIASQLASQTVLGAAQMVIETGKHPAQLRDMVTTPAGTTIEAIASLEHSGLRAALIDAIAKAAARSREMG